ncbi:MAG: menaquinone biosynthesis decarboxylase [Archaeoglobaceae archaeon]
MPYRDLREFMERLEKENELARINTELSPILEITEVTNRVVKKGGKALLFERPKGYSIPVLTNVFGSEKRMLMALEVKSFDEIGNRIISILKKRPSSIFDAIRSIEHFKDLLSMSPKKVKNAPCQEKRAESLEKFPILKCWPKDGGRFITLPVVITKDPISGELNAGVYRMQVFDEKTTGMHWQVHKHGAENLRKAKDMGMDKIEVAVAIGVDPAVLYSATAPVPEGVSEFAFAGFLRGEKVEMVECETVDLMVPATAEIVLEGFVRVDELRIEGPFGDHTGYYTPPEPYPVFHIENITHRENPIYHATIVGKPPMEDAWLGKATERIFLPLIKFLNPEIVDMNLPVEGGFHGIAIVSIKKRYPGQAKKVMYSLWGLGMLSLTKIIIVVDEDINVHNIGEVLWAISTRFDPARDALLLPPSPTDALDHSAYIQCLAGKLGIDATKKMREEGYEREWPEVVEMSEEVKAKINGLWEEIRKQL